MPTSAGTSLWQRKPVAHCCSRIVCTIPRYSRQWAGGRAWLKQKQALSRAHDKHQSCRQWGCISAAEGAAGFGNFEHMDSNELQTALNIALASEDYGLAAKLRDQLQTIQGKGHVVLDWRALGTPDWLAKRAEQMGYKFPAGVSRLTAE